MKKMATKLQDTEEFIKGLRRTDKLLNVLQASFQDFEINKEATPYIYPLSLFPCTLS